MAPLPGKAIGMVGWNSSKQSHVRSSRSLIGDNALPYIEPREPAIVLSRAARDFVLKPRHLNQLPTFLGRVHENPLSFIREFTSTVATMPFSRLSTEDRFMICFPHRLEGEAKIWYLDIAPRSLKTWEMVCAKFVSRYYSPERTRELRKKIVNFEQTESENLHEAWERFKSLERECPHHNFLQDVLLSFFFNSLTLEDANRIELWAGGDFGKLTPEEGRNLLEDLSEERRQVNVEPWKEEINEFPFELKRSNEHLARKDSSNLGYSPKPEMIPIEEEEESTYRPEVEIAAQDSEEDDEVDDEFEVPNEISTKCYECPLFEDEDSSKEEEAQAIDRWLTLSFEFGRLTLSCIITITYFYRILHIWEFNLFKVINDL
ncbi:hypothetical protein CASFOL_026305 [Castilleja foliolosa]|uniref:Retrotransposon gag domain-containing protein n=1 Tax=Castilleja foliolosa TaxID=1961234 RepID=A0ABD3CJ94_9LAMI